MSNDCPRHDLRHAPVILELHSQGDSAIYRNDHNAKQIGGSREWTYDSRWFESDHRIHFYLFADPPSIRLCPSSSPDSFGPGFVEHISEHCEPIRWKPTTFHSLRHGCYCSVSSPQEWSMLNWLCDQPPLRSSRAVTRLSLDQSTELSAWPCTVTPI